jgi:hypothetical protein
MRTYKPQIVLRVLVVLFLALPGAVLVGLAVASEAHPPTLAIGLPLIAVGALLFWLAGRAELTVDEHGVRRRGYFGGVTKMRFDQVAAYYYSSTSVNGVETVRFWLRARDGSKITVTSNWRDFWDLVRRLAEGAEAHGLADQKAGLAGKRVDFGPVTIDGEFLCAKGKRVAFTDIQSVDIPAAWLRVSQHGKLLAAFSIDSGKVPNIFLLLDELRARGVSAPDARPWRATVNLSGYQLPRK